MGDETKLSEERGAGCGTRFFDVVQVNGQMCIKVKCRRCTKSAGQDMFHYFDIDSIQAKFSVNQHPSA